MIQSAIEEGENKAILTHCILNLDTPIATHYKKKAQHILAFLEVDTDDDRFCKSIGIGQVVLFPHVPKPKFTFIDLFAGIGGFRMALQELEGHCVFTSEWDVEAKKTYATNYGEYPFGDITKQAIKALIPDKFDVLCAGFPCQPFSKGGQQNGFEDTRGTLFFDLCEIIEKHHPKVLFLENVSNLISHDKGHTYEVILKNLDKLGYIFPDKPLVLSPDKFGVPILRPRVYIPCVRKDLAGNKEHLITNIQEVLSKQYTEETASIDTILDPNLKPDLSSYELKVLKMWDAFYKGIDLKIIGFPIWMEYFQFEGRLEQFPDWKSKFIQKNMDLYARNQKFIDRWLKKYDNLAWCTNTHKKMEWQAGDKYSSVFECLIQFRPSGVRVKRPEKFSTLVAMNHRQIIGKYKRRITVEESKLLQSFPKKYQLSSQANVALKQLGNSVNVKVIAEIFKILRTFL